MNAYLLEKLSVITEEEQRILDGNEVDISNYVSGKNFVIDSAKMLEKGRLISIRPHTRFASFPEHRHNYVEIIYMCSGSTNHIINNKTRITLGTGELLLINQHASHSIERADYNDIAVNFIVLPEFFDVALTMIGPDNLLSNFLISSLRNVNGDIGFLHFKVKDVLPVQNLVENLIWSLVKRIPNYKRINQVTMGLLFLELLNYTDCMDMEIDSNVNSLVVSALREIEENYKNANLTEIAKRFNVSVAYISRLIKQSTGNTFKELLQTKKLSVAASLLANSRLSVNDIIAAVGYDNTSYFYRIFKEKYNLSPTLYRKMVK
ncbi:MAG TPA: AraC family transcriptional regulator [Candidatus Avimonas sp.]|nr:AraC family transcriptional regulator [Clostridiales bacterium]HPU58842.1 AraC family transcriptional regulator [Candidatus Avimonas sp.]